MERPKTFIGHRLNFFTPTYFFWLFSIRRPFYSSHRRDSSAHGTGPLMIQEPLTGEYTVVEIFSGIPRVEKCILQESYIRPKIGGAPTLNMYVCDDECQSGSSQVSGVSPDPAVGE